MNEREMALLAKCGELEHSLSDAMEQIEAIQGSSAVHMAKVAELEEQRDLLQGQVSVLADGSYVKSSDKERRILKRLVAELEDKLTRVAAQNTSYYVDLLSKCNIITELQTQLDRDLSRARVAATVDVASTGEAFDILERAMVDLTREKSEAMAQLDRANGELREWHCDTFVGRCPGCPDCQPVGGTMPQTLERNAADDEKGKRHE